MIYKDCYEMLKLNKTRGMRRTSWQNNLILTIDKSNSIVYNYNWLYCFTKEDLEATDWEIV
jgi:hypothetical protein